jgi:hypothetical protein
VRLPDGRLFVTDDGPDLKQMRAAIWNPADGKSSAEIAPNDAGQSVALLIDRQGTLTLVRSGLRCHQVSIWRRRPGEAWRLAHVEASNNSCAVGAFALDDNQIVYWFQDATPGAKLWSAASDESRTVDVPASGNREHLIALGGGQLLSVGWGKSHLYVPGLGWRATGVAGGDDQSTFTALTDGRVLMVAPYSTRVWTRSEFSTEPPCIYLMAQLEGAASGESFHLDQPRLENVGPACRAAIVADPNLEASRALRDLAQSGEAERRRRGILAICELRVGWAVDIMTRGLAPNDSYDQGATCLVALTESEQPAARQAVDAYAQDCIRGDRSSAPLVAAAHRSEMARALAAEVLVLAWRDRRPGFDQLRDVVCRSPIPTSAVAICRESIAAQELQWRNQPKRRHAWRMTGVATAIGAGLAVGGYAARNSDGGRVIAVVAGGLGAGALLFPSLTADHPGPLGGLDQEFQGCLAVTTGVLGAVGAALATGSPGASRAAISILGGVLFSGLSLAATWSF